MASTFHLEDKVTYLFGDAPQYKVVATKQQPRVRNVGAFGATLPPDFDYLIVIWPLSEGMPTNFIPVREAHISLLR